MYILNVICFLMTWEFLIGFLWLDLRFCGRYCSLAMWEMNILSWVLDYLEEMRKEEFFTYLLMFSCDITQWMHMWNVVYNVRLCGRDEKEGVLYISPHVFSWHNSECICEMWSICWGKIVLHYLGVMSNKGNSRKHLRCLEEMKDECILMDVLTFCFHFLRPFSGTLQNSFEEKEY